MCDQLIQGEHFQAVLAMLLNYTLQIYMRQKYKSH